jgi:hypothetical protein
VPSREGVAVDHDSSDPGTRWRRRETCLPNLPKISLVRLNSRFSHFKKHHVRIVACKFHEAQSEKSVSRLGFGENEQGCPPQGTRFFNQKRDDFRGKVPLLPGGSTATILMTLSQGCRGDNPSFVSSRKTVTSYSFVEKTWAARKELEIPRSPGRGGSESVGRRNRTTVTSFSENTPTSNGGSRFRIFRFRTGLFSTDVDLSRDLVMREMLLQ